jgi:diguanylate cyclase (GGDEF)-like protein
VSTADQTTGSIDPQLRRLRRSWWFFATSFLVLGALVVFHLVVGGGDVDDLFVGAAVVVVGYTAIVHRNAVHQLEVGRRAEAESFARILQGLSRSVSPDAIVDAIVEELGTGAGADHIVVVRRRHDGAGLEARLVSARPGVPSSTTLFPLSDLEDSVRDYPGQREPVALPVVADEPDLQLAPTAIAAAAAAWTRIEPQPAMRYAARPPSRPVLPPSTSTLVRGRVVASRERFRHELERLVGTPGETRGPLREGASAPVAGAAARIADRIAARTRSAYALRNTLAAPLVTHDGVIGAIVLSRRRAEPWSPSARRILEGAAIEASAALARATHHRDAETRATTDGLTGLPNRRYFDEFCGLLSRRRRADDAVGILLIDIDLFKTVNDTFGHAAGDDVLRSVARAIAAAVREEDVPARFGGEEFVVLLRNPSRDVAIDVGERVRAAVGRLNLQPAGPPSISVSVGVAVATAPDQPIADLVEAADRALYEAKRAGRNRVVAAD